MANINGHINKDLKGTIILPTLGTKSKKAGDKVVITEKELDNKDIKAAIISGQLIIDKNKTIKTIEVKNITKSSFVLGDYGIIRSGEIKSINKLDLELPSIKELLDNKQISLNKNEKIAKNEAQISDKTENIKGKSIKNKVIRKAEDNNEEQIFVNGLEPHTSDDITFVDIEQREERVSDHPILGKRGKQK